MLEPAARRGACCSCSTTASTSWTTVGRSSAGCWTPRPGARAVPRASGRSGSTARRARRSPRCRRPTRSRCSRSGRPARRASAFDADAAAGASRAVPRAGRAAARHRAGGGPRPDATVPEIARRLDDRFALLADPTGRAARAPARPRGRAVAGATTCCSRTTSAACGRWPGSPAARRSTRLEHVLAALDVPAAVGDRRGGPAGRPLAGDGRRATPGPPATACSTASGPSRSAGCTRPAALERACAAHAEWYAGAAARAEQGLRGPDQAGQLAVLRPSAPTSTRPSPGPAGTTRRRTADRRRLRLGLVRPRRPPARRRPGASSADLRAGGRGGGAAGSRDRAVPRGLAHER